MTLNNHKSLINLVTGGAGFIGSNLIKELLDRNQKVICVDNLSSGALKNIESFLGNENFNFFEKDINSPLHFKVDRIWHLASNPSPHLYQKNPLGTAYTSFNGTLNILKLARQCKARILFTSSSEVYGEPLQLPTKEEDFGNLNPISVRACYSEGKRIAETLCSDFYRLHNLDIKIARIFNTYGPKMSLDDGRVISKFINNGISNKPLTIYGTGEQTRSFCYVSDTVRALLYLMDSNYNFPINIGSNNEITINKLSNLISSKINISLKNIYMPLPEDDPKRRNPCIQKAREILKWYPLISLDTGLKKTIDFYVKLR